MQYQNGYGVEMPDQTDPRSMKEFGAASGALRDLAFDGGALTRSLLGARLRHVEGQ
jgi:hypothetical protein